MESRCSQILLQMMMDFGAVAALAQQPYSTWDITRIAHVAEGLKTTAEECAMFVNCRDEAVNLLDSLRNVYGGGEEANPDKVPQQLDLLSENMSHFVGCLFEAYDTTVRVMFNGHDRDEHPYPWGDWTDFPTQPQRQKELR
jgi:hypothetical protein